MSPSARTASANRIGLLAATSFVIGNVIGSGIFITPGGVLRAAGSVGLSLLAWTACACVSALGALCYVELGTSVRRSGADVAYLCFVGWPSLAFAFVATNALLYYPCVQAIFVQTFGAYALAAVEPIICVAAEHRGLAARLLGLTLLYFIAFLNFHSLRKVAKLQLAVECCKMLSMGLIIAVGLYYLLFRGWTKSFNNAFEGSKTAPGDLVLALYSGLWAYDGWDTLNFGVEEIKNPRRNFPLASLLGVLIVFSVYISVNIAYFVALDKQEILQSSAVAASFGQKTLAGASSLIPVMICVLMSGTINSSMFRSTRSLLEAGRQNILPSYLSLTHVENDSPTPAVATYVIMGTVASLVPDVNLLIKFVVFVNWLQRIFTLAAMLKIRLCKLPVAPDAIKMPLLLHVAFMAVCVILVAVPLYESPSVFAVGVAVVISSYAVYLLLINRRHAATGKIDGCVARYIGKLFLVSVRRPTDEHHTLSEL